MKPETPLTLHSKLIWLLPLCMAGLCLGHYLPYLFFLPAPAPTPPGRQMPAQPTTAAAQRVLQTPPALTPTWIPAPITGVTDMPVSPPNPVMVTILYDNNPYESGLTTAWGFACLVESGETTVLFDAGGSGPTLLSNMAALDIDPRTLDAVILSHGHSDHTGGLDAVLAVNDRLAVYLPQSFAPEYKTWVSERASVVEVSGPVVVADGIRTTGELGTTIVEQSLIVETDEGLIVLTGCAHPGVVEIVRRAEVYGEVYLVMGGFHLKDKSAGEIGAVITELKRLGVQKIAPCHCTGEQAIRLFEAAFGPDFIRAGAGLRLLLQK